MTKRQQRRFRKLVGGVIYSLSFLVTFLALSIPLHAQGRERHYRSVSVNVERGIKVGVDNRTTGGITVTGWDRDTIEARAVSSRGDEVVVLDRHDGFFGTTLTFIGDYADLDNPAAPNVRVDSPPEVDGQSLKVHLEVKVPRYVEIQEIEVWRSDVRISNVDSAVVVDGERGTVTLTQVASARVHTSSGAVEIDGVKELASVVTTTGAIRVSNSKKLLVAVSITGSIDVRCSTGRVDVSNADAPITLENIDGDVEAIGTNSNVRLSGGLREDARYRLKSMSGRVDMIVSADTRGFEAVLSSYQGAVETDFKFANAIAADGTKSRRMSGRFGNGKAQVLLDSFQGPVRLMKGDARSMPACK